MAYAADFVSGQALFKDRSISVSTPSGPFQSVTKVHKLFAGFAAYAPSISLPAKPRTVKIKGKSVELVTIPPIYSDLYITLARPCAHYTTWIEPTDLIVVYKGQARLSYTAKPRIGALPARARVFDFDATVWLELRRSDIEQFEAIHIMPPGGAQTARLFPECTFVGGFYYPCAFPFDGVGDCSLKHQDGFVWIAD